MRFLLEMFGASALCGRVYIPYIRRTFLRVK
jgi:hypothetical protein